MNILIYTTHSSEWQPLADITLPVKHAYAERHGYNIASREIPPKWHPVLQQGYGKIHDLLEIARLGEFDWIWWTGTDILITNQSVTLESIIAMAPADAGLIIANDCLMWSADSFLIRTCPRIIAYLEKILMRDTPIPYGLHEQETMWVLRPMINYFEVPQRAMNSYFYQLREKDGATPEHRANVLAQRDLLGNDGQWQHGDFVIHITPAEMPARLKIAERMAQGHVPRFDGNQIIFDA
jgi:glycosyl transferase family (putative galactosyltransferase)